MTTPQQNTKIETLVEAIETFSIAIARDVAYPPAAGTQARCVAEEREEAREEMASALRDFLAPSLRVITEVEHKVGAISKRTSRTIERTSQQ